MKIMSKKRIKSKSKDYEQEPFSARQPIILLILILLLLFFPILIFLFFHLQPLRNHAR